MGFDKMLWRPLIVAAFTLLSPGIAGAAISGVVVPANIVYQGPCDTISGCAAAYSMTRSVRSAYTGNLFQLYNGTTTLNVGQVNHVVDTSGVPAFCAGVLNGCVVSKIYDQSGNGNDLLPVNSSAGAINPPSQCGGGSGNVCAAIYWVDPFNGLPAIVTSYPAEYDSATTGINGGANPVSVFFYGRDDASPGQFGLGHTPSQNPLVNGTDFIAQTYASNRGFLFGGAWPSGYFNCAALGAHCAGIDEETSVEPYTVSTAAGGIGTTYNSGAAGDIKVMITYDGAGVTGTVKGYTNSSTALFTVNPPSSQQYDSSTLLPGTHVKLGCGGDCTQSMLIFREGIIANATLSSSDYTALDNNVTTFYALHTTRATCAGGADIGYYNTYDNVTPYTEFAHYSPPGNGFMNYALAQIRESYFGPIADLNNGTTTTTYNSARAAGSTGCGLDPAAATFCTAGSLGHCIVTKLYNQGTVSRAATQLSNIHDTALDLVFASGQRPTVTFASLNGLPVMNFTGAGERGCATPANAFPGWFALSAVARRTSGATTVNILDLASAGDEIQIGFNNSANTAFMYAAAGLGTQSASDAHWHHIYFENLGSNLYHPYIDGSAGSTVTRTTATNGVQAAQYCIGTKGDGTQSLTGDIAEIDILNVQAAPGLTNGAATQASPMFSSMQTTWGALPN